MSPLNELHAMHDSAAAMRPLRHDERRRVIGWLRDYFEVRADGDAPPCGPGDATAYAGHQEGELVQ